MHDGISTQQVWLPEDCDWYELSSGTLLRGGQTVERKFQLDEYPVYVKAGSVLPEYGKVENLSSTSEPITVAVYPGKGDSSFTLYEDNGNDKDYAHEYAYPENGRELKFPTTYSIQNYAHDHNEMICKNCCLICQFIHG